MAKPLSNLLSRGITGLSAARSNRNVAGSFYNNVQRYSTTVPKDPDTHEDFQPNNKFESSDLSLKDIVEQDVKGNPVMIYMKGVPDVPQCGFSALAVRILKQYNTPLSARNILENPELKSAVKSFRWQPYSPMSGRTSDKPLHIQKLNCS
ncbi:monothiol glutaredoxin-S15, mitochondrial isoform X2 [Mercurialis annua]|uniref:monothiol glutaredoxin-S15, mitochondrial isoform X2 n=1 Tax=Mercurialis annua TaxID=3986 RepID=UPI00215F6EDD|nr:monothiol glutaredoxin-S15, mitochondrial isoform X2 [Mercurialis annua]